MRHLLDAHTLIWAQDAPNKLGPTAMQVLQDPAHTLVLSVGTLWELAIKVSLGRLTLAIPFRQWMEMAVATLGLELLAITLDHAEQQAALPWHHRDPFDRLLVAQALVEKLPVVSQDAALDGYGITRLW